MHVLLIHLGCKVTIRFRTDQRFCTEARQFLCPEFAALSLSLFSVKTRNIYMYIYILNTYIYIKHMSKSYEESLSITCP